MTIFTSRCSQIWDKVPLSTYRLMSSLWNTVLRATGFILHLAVSIAGPGACPNGFCRSTHDPPLRLGCLPHLRCAPRARIVLACQAPCESRSSPIRVEEIQRTLSTSTTSQRSNLHDAECRVTSNIVSLKRHTPCNTVVSYMRDLSVSTYRSVGLSMGRA